ncbi:LPXTG cell wall anchor domain-containing protein, partial [Nitrosomonas sp. Nm132]
FAVGAGGKSNLPYIIGAIVLAAAGAFFFMRSKKNKTEAA